MCGIIGYVGSRECKPLLLQGLERLEYRGYDSAGIALLEDDGLDYVRAVGPLGNLKDARRARTARPRPPVSATRAGRRTAPSPRRTRIRWPAATPRSSRSSSTASSRTTASSRRASRAEGHTFSSETDAETVTHLVERHYDGDLVEAVRRAFAELEGHFAFVVIHHDHPGLLVGARHQVPLVVGIGERRDVPRLERRRVPRARRAACSSRTTARSSRSRPRARRSSASTARRSSTSRSSSTGTTRAPRRAASRRSCSRRSTSSPRPSPRRSATASATGRLVLEGLGMTDEEVRDLRRIVIVACGTAYHACVVGRYVIEEWARVPVEHDIASEWIYRNPVHQRARRSSSGSRSRARRATRSRR